MPAGMWVKDGYEGILRCVIYAEWAAAVKKTLALTPPIHNLHCVGCMYALFPQPMHTCPCASWLCMVSWLIIVVAMCRSVRGEDGPVALLQAEDVLVRVAPARLKARENWQRQPGLEE